MDKFKIGDWVELTDGSMYGEIVYINNEGYTVEFSTAGGGGTIMLDESNLVLIDKPDFIIIPIMNEADFDEAVNTTIKQMHEQIHRDTSEQWLLDGECSKCRRNKFCNKQCRINKENKNKMIHNAIERKIYFEAMVKDMKSRGVVFNDYSS